MRKWLFGPVVQTTSKAYSDLCGLGFRLGPSKLSGCDGSLNSVGLGNAKSGRATTARAERQHYHYQRNQKQTTCRKKLQKVTFGNGQYLQLVVSAVAPDALLQTPRMRLPLAFEPLAPDDHRVTSSPVWTSRSVGIPPNPKMLMILMLNTGSGGVPRLVRTLHMYFGIDAMVLPAGEAGVLKSCICVWNNKCLRHLSTEQWQLELSNDCLTHLRLEPLKQLQKLSSDN